MIQVLTVVLLTVFVDNLRWFAITPCRDSNDKDMGAMLVELTIEANEESFVIILQHGGNDVTCKQFIIAIHCL